MHFKFHYVLSFVKHFIPIIKISGIYAVSILIFYMVICSFISAAVYQ
jgi:hypothetical protein